MCAKQYGQNGSLPYFLCGHSWGSMITRDYAAKYGKDLAGIVIIGTSGSVVPGENMLEPLEKLRKEGHGKEPGMDALMRMFAGWNDRYDNVKTPSDWACGDPDVVADDLADPFCVDASKTMWTNDALYGMSKIMSVIGSPDWAGKVPKELPVLNMAGDQDPVGNFGQGVYETSNRLIATGHKVKTIVYPGRRHEIHNYRDIRDEVVGNAIKFFDEHLK
jgi:alpha-beta hydrolase superfamily lysophospholipase